MNTIRIVKIPKEVQMDTIFGADAVKGLVRYIQIDGQEAECFGCRVSAIPFNCVWPGHQRPLDQTELASFISFEMTEPVELEVPIPEGKSGQDVIVRPISSQIKVNVENGKVRLTIPQAGYYSLEIDGRNSNLHIFANPMKDFTDFAQKATYSFGPGVHHAGLITLHDGESLYLDANAYVFGVVRACDASQVRIDGYGILDGSFLKREDADSLSGIGHFTRCHNLYFGGLTLVDSAAWTVTLVNCVNMEFDHVKVVGQWRYNTDGFDFVNSQNGHIHDCFLRTFDDTIVLKGLYLPEKDGSRPVEKMDMCNYLIENNVLWCDWGGAMEIGAETVADHYDNIVWRNSDILRTDHGALRIQSGDRAHISHMLYENIRIEYTKYDTFQQYQVNDEMVYGRGDEVNTDCFIKVWMYRGLWSPDNIYGHVENIEYRDIQIFGDPEVEPRPNTFFRGADAEHGIDGVKLKNITWNGQPHRFDIETNEFVKNIQVDND